MFVEFRGDIRNTREASKKQLEKELEYTKKWTLTANVKTCIAAVCNDDKVNAVSSDCKWDNQELPILDQNKHFDVKTANHCTWDSHTEKVLANG